MQACPNHPSEFEVRRCSRCARSYCKNCLVLLRGSYYCADCKGEQIRDVQSGADGGRLDYAPMGTRLGAILIDGLVQLGAILVLACPIGFAFVGAVGALQPKGSEPSAGMMIGIFAMYAYVILVSLAVPFAYEGWMLSRGGQTLGKKALGIKVVTPEGNPITPGQAWGRAGMRLALNFVCSGIIDWVPALFNDEKQCLHDMVAGTRVVRG